MALKQELEAVQAKSRERIPAEKRAIMERATEDLRQSGMVDHSLKVGDPMPSFELSNASGNVIRSVDLLAKGSLVVSFYRGGW
jgi:hypothetical protein